MDVDRLPGHAGETHSSDIPNANAELVHVNDSVVVRPAQRGL